VAAISADRVAMSHRSCPDCVAVLAYRWGRQTLIPSKRGMGVSVRGEHLFYDPVSRVAVMLGKPFGMNETLSVGRGE